MINIMKADLFRLRKGKGMYICLLAIIALCSVSIYMRSPGHVGLNGGMTSSEVVKELDDDASMEDVRAISKNIDDLDVAMMQANGNLYYPIIYVVFALVCMDLSIHTAKNVISTNISRKTYYLSKLLLSCIIAIGLLAFSTYVGYFGNIIFNQSEHITPIVDITIILLRQIPIFCGIISVLVMIAVFMQKASRFNAISILLVMMVQMVLGLVITLTSIEPTLLMQFEFETILRSLAVAGGISIKTFVIGIGTGFVLLIASTAIGLTYFKKCNIR